MDTVELTAYISRAKELESAIYTHRKMMNAHNSIMAKASPTKPIARTVPLPKQPIEYTPLRSANEGGSWLFGILCIGLAGIYIILLLASLFLRINPTNSEGFGGGLFGSIIMGVLGWIIIRNLKEKDKQIEIENSTRRRQYDLAIAEYGRKIAEHSVEIEKANNEYAVAMETYNNAVNEYNSAMSAMIAKYEQTLQGLINALENHYAQDVVFGKYRNLIAVSTFEEYLLSGRCETLSGANGAYNLYEMELRQNVIINQLSSIITNLEQIRNNQYTLYQELIKANDTVTDVLREVHGVGESAKMVAYFSAVNAKIAASPRKFIARSF